MHREQRAQTTDLFRSRGIDRALLADIFSIKWLTGFDPPVEFGQNIFQGAGPLLWYESGHFTLLIPNVYDGAAGQFDAEIDGSVRSYPGYTVDHPLDFDKNLAGLLEGLFFESGLNGRRVGVETAATSLTAGWVLAREKAEIGAIDGWLAPLRRIKTGEELVKLRANFALADLGHGVARGAVAAGLREIDIWTEVTSAIQRECGGSLPLGNDCVVNSRQNNIGGRPGTEVIPARGSLLLDLSPQRYGYWGDSCAVYYPAEPTPRQQEIHRTVQEALDLAISLVRPGASAADIDWRVRQFIADQGYPVYPHHTGHGVGVANHESPRLVPNSSDVLAAGMVIMLEPGIYFPGEAAVRLEDAVLVTPDGAEILTKHDKSMPG